MIFQIFSARRNTVNITPERALLQKVMAFLNLNENKKRLNFNKIVALGVSLSQRSPGIMQVQNQNKIYKPTGYTSKNVKMNF